ncbi:hypothetical protein VE02_02307 [Pseudogymnoascus sp. 03VT05]|nr:hypothetical protein VE02_02307 [Pseudogymnoascus sp. 03VT05]
MESKPLLPKVEPYGGDQPQQLGAVDMGSPWRRSKCIIAYGAILLTGSVLLFSKPTAAFGWPFWAQPPTIEERASKILSHTPLIDGHNDLAILVRERYNNHINGEKFQKMFLEGGMPAHVDLSRLKEGKVGGAFWSAFIPCPKNGSDFSNENYAHSVSATYSQLDLLRRLQSLYPTHLSPPPNSTTALSHFRAHQLISPLAIEGLHQIGNSASTLRTYHTLGVRYATLTHNCHNIYADAAVTELPGGNVEKSTPLWGGVSPAGRKIIKEMNRLGVLVDLAHVSRDTMLGVLGGGSSDWTGSAAPPIFSHSCAYALCPHPRNVPDEVLHLVKAKGSVVMINFMPDFVSCHAADPPNESGLPDFDEAGSTLERVADHVVYIGELIGFEHVGIGSDFDGIGRTPRGLEDVTKFPDLVGELLRRGVSDGDVAKVVGGNILRVWAEADRVALRMQGEGEMPLEDDLPSVGW